VVRSLLPLLALLLLLGCSAHRSGDAVGAMSFTFDDGRNGLARFGRLPAQRALKNAMAHPQGRAQAFLVPGLVEPTWLNRETLDEDAYRLEIWYANEGFFDARFLGWELVARGGPGKKARRFDVRGRISEGEPSRIRGIRSASGSVLPGATARIRTTSGERCSSSAVSVCPAWASAPPTEQFHHATSRPSPRNTVTAATRASRLPPWPLMNTNRFAQSQAERPYSTRSVVSALVPMEMVPAKP
jgi:hypothetical protein